MAVKFRDYYEILEVDRSATQDEIRKSFRKLARKYHPDVAEDKETAEEKFKELNEAYEVLSDPEKRQTYDALGPGWEHGSEFAPPPGGPGSPYSPGMETDGSSFRYHFGGSTGFSDFFESVFGARAAGDPFGAFTGFRRDRGRSDRPSRGNDVEADLLVPLEGVMSGAERQLRLRRPVGAGVSKDTLVKVHVPKGIGEGQLIRCAGLGEPGVNGGNPGDLFLRVRLERHPDFEVDGADLYMEIVIDPWDSVLGSSVPIRTLHGSLNLKIPVGTQPGTKLRIKEKGLPEHAEKFGDLYITVQIRVPEVIDKEERRLWEALASRAKSKKG
ncbi:MAG: J domain-containing protein [Verrucomicrobiae bacterium]|nr:J domain-containing protein [Verrucomicrobiae bacterium]